MYGMQTVSGVEDGGTGSLNFSNFELTIFYQKVNNLKKKAEICELE